MISRYQQGIAFSGIVPASSTPKNRHETELQATCVYVGNRLFVSESISDFLDWVGDKPIDLLCPVGEVLSRSEALNDSSWARFRRSPGYTWEEPARCHSLSQISLVAQSFACQCVNVEFRIPNEWHCRSPKVRKGNRSFRRPLSFGSSLRTGQIVSSLQRSHA